MRGRRRRRRSRVEKITANNYWPRRFGPPPYGDWKMSELCSVLISVTFVRSSSTSIIMLVNARLINNP